MKRPTLWMGIITCTLIAVGVVIMTNRDKGLIQYLPAPPEGWVIDRKDQIYNSKSLYQYIDGGAELYLSYNFKKVVSRIYTAPGQPDILLDLFDMGSSKDAFGVFSHSREMIDTTFGQGSQYTGGLLLFWKERYFVSILASPETEESKKVVFHLAEMIDTTLPGRGPLPEILSLLPQKLLIEESVRYFHHYMWLNSHYFIAQENILHIDEKTDAVLAKYNQAKNPTILLLIKYPEMGASGKAYQHFMQHYLPELSRQSAVQIEDGSWTAGNLIKAYVILVFNAPEEPLSLSLIEMVKNRLKNLYNFL